MEDIWFFAGATFLSILFIFFFQALINRRDQQTKKNFPPSPPSLPIIGHLHLLKDPLHRNLRKLSSQYGDVLLLRLGSRKALVVSSPSAVEECFTKNDIVFVNRPRMISGDYLTYNYTTPVTAPYGELWRMIRRLAALDVFSPARMAAFSDVRRNEVRLLMNRIRKRCDGDGDGGEGGGGGGGAVKVDMREMFVELCFNTLSMTIAGKRYYGDESTDMEEARMAQYIMKEMLRLSGNTNLADFLPFLRCFDLQGIEKKFSKFRDEMDNFLQGLVNYCRQKRSSNANNAGGSSTLIDHMLTLQEEEPKIYSDQQIKAISLVLLVAVTDTLSITLEWGLSLLLNHPMTMRKVECEINANVPPNRLLNEEDLPNLPFLQNVISETLRLYPPLPFLLPHAADEDCTVAGFAVPRGTMLLVNLWGLHRDPKLWDDPDSFVPERHETTNPDKRKSPNYNMIPFGVGRRGCPGIGMGHRIIGLGLGNLIHGFEWEREDEGKIDMSELSGMNLPKAQPLLAICKPKPMAIPF